MEDLFENPGIMGYYFLVIILLNSNLFKTVVRIEVFRQFIGYLNMEVNSVDLGFCVGFRGSQNKF